jgi:hypothetical protein
LARSSAPPLTRAGSFERGVADTGPMENSPKCQKRKLAARGSFSVDRCECGAIHLTLGFVTIRLEPRAYRELADTIFDGLQMIDRHDQPTIH